MAVTQLEGIYKLFVERLESFEVLGPLERLTSITNGSIKHLPLRYRMA